ncbi:NAD(P)H-dependent flavin oxidoreductase, partial [Deinococcus pimensis]|uniref:NAD(P)H-dependent flavin oxidoreductase n=1 Tax=Deinococcus pimensis TaxID=309888 RepID=UPI0005EBC69D
MLDLPYALGLTAPVLQAPMAGSQDHRLAVSAASAGALGALPAATLDPAGLEHELRAFHALSAAPLNVNFFCHPMPTPDPHREAAWRETLRPYYEEFGLPLEPRAGPLRRPFDHDAADVLEAFRPAVVSFHFGLPALDLLDRVKRWGALVLSSATTVDEARYLEARGVDVVIAQGVEAGGHRGMFLDDDPGTQVGTFALLPQVTRTVSVPVIAAGGVADARGVRAARLLG